MKSAKSEAHTKARELYQSRKEEKSEGLKARQSARAARSDKEQLARLDTLLGKGLGAKRERAKLQARIDSPKKAKKGKSK